MSYCTAKQAPLRSIAQWPSVARVDANTLSACSSCGSVPAEIEDGYKPEIVVLNMNFGDPYQYGVHCRVCGRIAVAIGETAAVKAWNDKLHQFDSL